MKPEVKKLILSNLPYLIFVYLFGKLGQAYRLAAGVDLSEKLLHFMDGCSAAFANAAPSLSSDKSFSLWLTRCRCSLSSRMISGLKYRSTGRPQFLISCMITGKLGIVPSFSIFARYRQSIFTFSAIALRDKCFAFRAAFTSAPKVSKPGQFSTFAI